MLLDRLFQNAKIHTRMMVRWNLHSFHAERFDSLKDCKISWALRSDDIARFADRPQAQIERFHGTAGDRHVLREKAAAKRSGSPRNLLTENKASGWHDVAAAVHWILARYAANDRVESVGR